MIRMIVKDSVQADPLLRLLMTDSFSSSFWTSSWPYEDSSLIFALTLRCGLLNLWTNLFMRFQTNMAQGFRNQFRSIVPVPSVTAWVNFGYAQHMFPNMEASRPISPKRGCAFRRNMVTHSRPRYTPYFACVLTTPKFGLTPVKETLML